MGSCMQQIATGEILILPCGTLNITIENTLDILRGKSCQGLAKCGDGQKLNRLGTNLHYSERQWVPET